MIEDSLLKKYLEMTLAANPCLICGGLSAEELYFLSNAKIFVPELIGEIRRLKLNQFDLDSANKKLETFGDE